MARTKLGSGLALAVITWLVLAVAPAGLADHHKAQGKGYEKASGKAARKADQKARETSERSASERADGEERAEAARERGEEAAEEAGEGRGAEMRARRDERKAIMKDAKDAREPGTPQKGKKPWWRFWESDAGEATE